MTAASRRRVRVLAILVIGSALLIWKLWPSPAFTPSVKLPPGVSLAEALQRGQSETAKGWASNNIPSAPGPKLDLRHRAQLLALEVWAGIHEMAGRTLCRAPKQPTIDYVTPRLAECSATSGEKYLLAKEFVWEVDTTARPEQEWTFFAFVWGGTNQPRYARDTIALIEEGIVNHGVFGMHLNFPPPGQRGNTTFEYYPTNRCAIVRDTRGLVKVVPLDSLKAYVDAGLINLQNQK